MDRIELVFGYTEQEYMRAIRKYWSAYSGLTRRSLVIAGACFILALAFVVYTDGDWLAVVLLALAVMLLALEFLIYFYVPKRHFRALSKLREEYYLAFTDADIHWKTVSVDSHLKWDVYTKCWETHEFFYLIQAKNVYTVIPKRAFISEAQMQAFREMCGQAGLKLK